MLLAIVAVFTLPSFPDKAKWLNPSQKLYLFHKLEQDHGHSGQEKVTWSTVRRVSTDWVLWLQGSVYMCVKRRNRWTLETVADVSTCCCVGSTWAQPMPLHSSRRPSFR
jgi:hypothetical protein